MSLSKARRRFLIGLAAAGVVAGVSVPLLSKRGLSRLALRGKNSQAKLKVVFFVTPDGLGVDKFSGGGSWNGLGIWHPAVADGVTDTAEFTLNTASQELEGYRAQSLYLRWIQNKSRFGGHNAWKSILRDSGESMTSIDNLLGAALPGLEPMHNVIYAGPATKVGAGNPYFVSWINNAIRTPEKHPNVLYQNIFSDSSQASGTVRSANLFDPVLEDIREVRGQVNGSERTKLDTHLDSVEQLVSDLENTIPAVCTHSPPGELTDVDVPSTRNAVQNAHHQVVATALSCGISRVATIQVGYSVENMNILDVSDKKNPHDLAHWGIFEGAGSPSDQADWENCRRWYTKQVKAFLDVLAGLPDPDVEGDNLLEHTLVVFTSEMADGAPEHMMDMPLVLLGGASGLLMSGSGNGRYYDIKQYYDIYEQWDPPERLVSMQRIWATLAKAAGTEVPYGGNVEIVPGIFNNVS